MANAIFVFVVIGLGWWTFVQPAVGCSVAIVGFLMERVALATVPVAAGNSALCNYVTAALVGIAVVQQVRREGPSILWRFKPPALAVGVLLGFTYASSSWAIFPETTDAILVTHAPYLVVIVVLAPLSLQSESDVLDALRAIVWCSLVSLFLLLVLGDWQGRSVLTLGTDEVANPLQLTHSAGRLLIVAVIAREALGLRGNALRFVLGVVLIVVLLVFLKSASRGQIIASILTLSAFTLATRHRRVALGLVVLAGLTLGSGALDEDVARHASRWDPEAAASHIEHGRAAPSEMLLRVWQDSSMEHLMLGFGHGASRDPRLLGMYPHVVAIEVLAEEGFVGFALFIIALSIGVFYYYRAVSRSKGRLQVVNLALSAVLFYEVLISFKQGTLLRHEALHLAIILGGVCFGVLGKRETKVELS